MGRGTLLQKPQLRPPDPRVQQARSSGSRRSSPLIRRPSGRATEPRARFASARGPVPNHPEGT